MDFSINDLNILIEAIVAWEKEPFYDGMMESAAKMMCNHEKPNQQTMDEQIKKVDKARSIRTEIGTLIKAKLITNRRDLEAAVICDDSDVGGG
ncbi:MAG: hypothetical protein QQN44_06125 [Nitrosopumilus sp.]